MTEYSKHIEHGEVCSCKVLAQACGIDPNLLTFDYCHRVLHKHWRMTCRHGQPESVPVQTGLSAHWRDVGPIDPIKAILISNSL